jgi:hypothetical protein
VGERFCSGEGAGCGHSDGAHGLAGAGPELQRVPIPTAPATPAEAHRSATAAAVRVGGLRWEGKV